MARGNLVMGTARGKLGEVVFSRQNGQQVSRQYIRNPKNPKTQGQQIQRAIMATCAKMYGMGKEIFDHSFQGKGVPAGSMRRFLKVNADALRSTIVYHIENQSDPEESFGWVCSPNALSAAPNEYIISEGTFKAAPFTKLNKNNGTYGEYAGLNKVYANTLTVKQLFELFNIEAGDVFTMVVLSAEEGTMTQLTSPTTHFGTLRLIARQLDAGIANTPVSTATLGQAFKISSKGLSAAAVTNVADNPLWTETANVVTGVVLFNLSEVLPTGQIPACVGWIASHVGSKERSSATMAMCSTLTAEFWSVAAIDLIAAWSAGTSYAPSDLYLEGQGNAPSLMPENYVTLQTLGGGDVDIVGVKFVENDGVVLAKAVDVDGAEYYVKCLNARSDYNNKALTKLNMEAEDAPAVPADGTNDNTIGFNAYSATDTLKNATFSLFYGGGVDPTIASQFFLL